MTASPAPQQDSLAEAARKSREAKKDASKPPTVFNNDNMPTQGGISTVGGPSSDKHDDADKADKGDSKSGDANSEKAWRDKFAALRAKLARDKEDLNVMQRELGVLNLQNYSDPVKAMQQALTRNDINKKTADIDAKRRQSRPTSKPSTTPRTICASPAAIPAGHARDFKQWNPSYWSRIKPSCARCCARLSNGRVTR